MDDVKNKIKQITKTKEREFEKWKFALIMSNTNQPRYWNQVSEADSRDIIKNWGKKFTLYDPVIQAVFSLQN